MVDAVSPALGDVHQVRDAYADRVSIGIHARGAGIGAIERAIYSPDGAVTPFRFARRCACATWRPLRPRA